MEINTFIFAQRFADFFFIDSELLPEDMAEIDMRIYLNGLVKGRFYQRKAFRI